MLLRSVRIENFRAVERGEFSFDATTVLIGENDCGRSSIMEAIALVLGWNSAESEFRFEPYHFRASPAGAREAAPPIAIALEFGESAPGEWEGPQFEALRQALPHVLAGERRFRLEVAAAPGGPARWTFLAAGGAPLASSVALLGWLRRSMPVFWMAEGMMTGARTGSSPMEWGEEGARRLAEEVNRHYLDLLEGTAPNVPAAIESGSAAARQLLLAQARLVPQHMLGEVMEEITGKRTSRPVKPAAEPLRSSGTAAHKIGLLLLVGSFLRSGGSRASRGIHPLTLIESPEAHIHPMTLATIWGVIDRIAGQKIVATHSGTLLGCARLSSVRRLTRHGGLVKEWRVPEGALDPDELRRYTYHLRSRRAAASFARCWLLVEGETEFWLMSELARVCGYDFAGEGVVCVEFAQCGLHALVKVARRLGIEWHLLADGDAAGRQYATSARRCCEAGREQDRVTLLADVDLEHCFWSHGYQDVFRKAAYPRGCSTVSPPQRSTPAKAVIRRAIDRYSKPYLAVLLLDAVIDRGPGAVPPPLKRVIETCVRLARREPAGMTPEPPGS
jgi:putative ATP-dependent endonuclease of OLD family